MIGNAENTIKIRNNETISLHNIPLLPYHKFYDTASALLGQAHYHCVNYYGFPYKNSLHLICAVANDHDRTIEIFSCQIANESGIHLESLTAKHYAMHCYEREIAENFGVVFTNHPWLKPIRYPHDRANKSDTINTYPFYSIAGDQIHEVGVGPVHAGVIEPGHFRFICNGEMVLHLEIQLGWQHRGIEHLFLKKKKLLERTTLAENITGDTAVGHNLAFVSLMESLGNLPARYDKKLGYERALALEMERIGIHVGDLSAMCTDVAFQLGSAVFGALRTPIINYTQLWCGNRFGKGFLRTGGTNYPINEKLISKLQFLFDDFTTKFNEISVYTFNLPSVLSRFEGCGTVTLKQVKLIGAVGMVARMAGMVRDIRHTHPFASYTDIPYKPAVLTTGDVYARGVLRKMEIEKSTLYIQTLKQNVMSLPESPKPVYKVNLAPESFAISLVEGWRGEICHCAITDEDGELAHYKVKEPSLHNWLGLALALRNTEISDFPINNKSFDLSYCGYDL
ncbi:MAG: NADH dehydrogenase subunit [Cytophagales bacterium]|nr:MAG: NADH dehydrogenase subunit [Cytophagales bacterium]